MNYRPLLATALLSAALTAQVAHAQESPERRHRYFNAQARPYYRGPVRFTLGAGVGLYSGDLTSSLADNFPGPSFSGGVLYLVRPHLVIGGEATFFQLGAKDQLPERNLAFKSNNASLVSFVRYGLIRDESEFASQRGGAALIKPYIKAGLGFLLYNPKAYNGTTRPTNNTSYLSPERNDYSATAIVAPVGVGLTFRLTSQLSASAEGAYYFTTSDHLDDVSQRGNPNHNDGYGLVEVKLEYSPWGR